MRAEELFERLGGDFYVDSVGRKWPRFTPEVFRTSRKGIKYLKEAGLVASARTITVEVEALRPFLSGFDAEFAFEQYADDPDWLNETEAITKRAGQACYASYGLGRSKNTEEECARYLGNIKSQKHGSVIEHPNVTLFIYGVSRSLTHELVRHRIVDGPSQLSQRYVDGKILRFIERPEYQGYSLLHNSFENWVEMAEEEYENRRQLLKDHFTQNYPEFSKMSATEKRKAQNQAARACLPNETETHIYFTANLRSWRFINELRSSEHAEVEIRNLAVKMFLCLYFIAPTIFSDYKIKELSDGTFTIETEYQKV
ncbi:MAG: FAD-dependent thymidylate synthase [Candidatus Azambacteria bacterium]|nr:FAD-dependent thymidylate synthase [Candidatus Azambacteria bacterium]